MKKSLLAALIAGILLVTAGAFAGTISISNIPDVIVVNDGSPSGTAGDDSFAFSEALEFGSKVAITGGTSSEPITLSYAEVGADGTVSAEQMVTVEGVVQNGTIAGGISAEEVLGTVTALDVDGVLAVEFANATASTTPFAKTVRLFGKSGDTNPGSADFDISLEQYSSVETVDRFSTAGEVVVDDSFDTTPDGWTYTNQISGSTSSASGAGVLEITYSNQSAYGFWQRPGTLWTASSPKQGELYVMKAKVAATPATGQTGEGSVPDFRLNASSTGSTTLSTLQIINTYCTDAADANYIAPIVAGRDYNYIFEPNSLDGNTEQLMLQFEGYNFAGSLALGGTRPSRVGGKVALDSVVVTKLTDFITAEAGTAVATISSATDFAQGSGSTYGWRWEAGAGASNVGLTQTTASGSLSVALGVNTWDTADFPAGSYAYGSWDAYAIDATSPVTFEGQKLYRAKFTLTGSGVDYTMGRNNIQPNFRLQTGDFHQTCTASGYQAFGTAIKFTADPISSPKMNLWFYYDGATRSVVDRGGWSYKENTLWPSFEGIVATNGQNVPANATLTLSEVEITSHDVTLP